MNQLGTDFNSTGSVMTPAQRREQRRKRGECATCGQKCFQKRLFKMTPITDHGKVLDGRCLSCRPLESTDTGDAIPAVSRPATAAELQKFTMIQKQLHVNGTGSQRSNVSTGSSRVPSASPSTSAHNPTAIDRRASSRSLAARSDSSHQGPERFPERTPRQSQRNLATQASARSISRESVDTSGSPDDSSRSERRRPSNPEFGMHRGEAQRRRSNPESAVDSDQSYSGRYTAENESSSVLTESYDTAPQHNSNAASRSVPSGEELQTAMERIAGYRMDEVEAYALMSSGMKPAIIDNMTRSSRSAHRDRSSEDNHGLDSSSRHSQSAYEMPQHGVLDRGGAIGVVRNDSGGMGSQHYPSAYSSRSLQSNMSLSEEAIYRNIPVQRGNYQSMSALHLTPSRNASLRSVHSEAHALAHSDPPPRRAIRRDSNSSVQSSQSFRGTLSDHLSRHGTSDLDNSEHGDHQSTGALSRGRIPRRQVVRQRSRSTSSRPRDITEIGLGRLDDAGPDYVEIITIMRDFPGSAEVQLNCMEELSRFNFADEDYETLIETGGMEVIVDAVQAFPQDMFLQMSGCRAICNTSGTTETQIFFAQVGAIDLVLDAMGLFIEDPRMQEQGLAALANLAAAEENIEELIDKGTVPQAVAGMNKYPSDLEVQLKGCSVVTNLSSHVLDVRDAIMSSSGGGAVILAMVLHSQEAEVQDKALRALRNLSSNNEHIKVELAHMGAIDAVVQAMQVHRDDTVVQEAGACTLCNLAGNMDNKTMIGQCGGIDVIVRAMWVHSDAVTAVEWCCRGLYSLSLTEDNSAKVLQVGGITAAVNAMQAHAESSVVQEMSCALLCNLASESEEAKEKIVAEEALDAVVLAMVLFSEDVGVQEQACHLLLQLANEANLRSMQASNVSELVLAAAGRYPTRCQGPAGDLLDILDGLAANYNSNGAAITAP
jgi:hypothetical protein